MHYLAVIEAARKVSSCMGMAYVKAYILTQAHKVFQGKLAAHPRV